ncbi:DUF5999 family protein [Kitasatospora aureofaciens]|uniref:DUF5999 family protein n=1 Tax=Kitasatospora aureofaciens TaxID=1894 RepID=UPI00052651E8|nr:DUF5999 family protein [Kitasatospora aureofaciens]
MTTPHAAPPTSTPPGNQPADELAVSWPEQGWGPLKDGTIVFDDGGALGADGEVVAAFYERMLAG